MNERGTIYNVDAYRKALKNRCMSKSYEICGPCEISPGTAAALWNGTCKVSTKTISNLRRGLVLTGDELAEIFPDLYGGL